MQDKLLSGFSDASHGDDDADDAYGGALAGTCSDAWLARMKDRTIASIAMEHLEHSLHLFEGNTEETAAVHFEMATAHIQQLHDSGVAAGAFMARRTAAIRHAKKAVAGFEECHRWHDAAVAQRRLAEAHTMSGLTETPLQAANAAETAFAGLVEAEARFVKNGGSEVPACALSELRAG